VRLVGEYVGQGAGRASRSGEASGEEVSGEEASGEEVSGEEASGEARSGELVEQGDARA